MQDLYFKLVNTAFGKTAAQSLGLPSPIPLVRWKRSNQPFIEGEVLMGSAAGSQAIAALGDILSASAAQVFYASGVGSLRDSEKASSRAQPLRLTGELDTSFAALVFDATGITDTTELRALYDFFHPTIRKLASNGRILIIGRPPAECSPPAFAACQHALEGFTRSLGKEIGRKAATANLLRVSPGAAARLESSVRFFLSPRAAYVSAQVVHIGEPDTAAITVNPVTPLTGKVALVTGASRGIGKSIAETLARDGATLLGVDIPAADEELQQLTHRLKGRALTCDITAAHAGATIAEFVKTHFGGVDLVIHNAGVTRDKTLGKMPMHFWDMAIAVNMSAAQAIDEQLMAHNLIHDNGRIVCVSSLSGIAGNFGQTNYATAKSGLIGYVEAMAKELQQGITINAVAPGFIETQMTAAMPLTVREAGRRMNSLSQGGHPIDVAETIAWLCHPGSSGVNGNVVRVCGQSLLGR
ncbi:3-oxoacyl-ACP reductase [Marinobacter sp. X15-166B]|uniref:3-oxoacyl-ACP reductase n=1 Tax=Marinobacter sp. X15-166B TaxID=1897620 RepID=UPI00085C5008|nr:3-oxoacyl-ACP reductase [Marinobacter sp. X15-166B]OEY65111.1 3-oxoacyl-ACP reductase [Marinobacter sp. X15-166B]